jgi:hypothetical protein
MPTIRIRVRPSPGRLSHAGAAPGVSVARYAHSSTRRRDQSAPPPIPARYPRRAARASSAWKSSNSSHVLVFAGTFRRCAQGSAARSFAARALRPPRAVSFPDQRARRRHIPPRHRRRGAGRSPLVAVARPQRGWSLTGRMIADGRGRGRPTGRRRAAWSPWRTARRCPDCAQRGKALRETLPVPKISSAQAGAYMVSVQAR